MADGLRNPGRDIGLYFFPSSILFSSHEVLFWFSPPLFYSRLPPVLCTLLSDCLRSLSYRVTYCPSIAFLRGDLFTGAFFPPFFSCCQGNIDFFFSLRLFFHLPRYLSTRKPKTARWFPTFPEWAFSIPLPLFFLQRGPYSLFLLRRIAPVRYFARHVLRKLPGSLKDQFFTFFFKQQTFSLLIEDAASFSIRAQHDCEETPSPFLFPKASWPPVFSPSFARLFQI